MQLAVQTMGEYEVIYAELIDDLCIPFCVSISVNYLVTMALLS
jgi:hypothetical protein